MSFFTKKCYHFSQIFQDWPILNFQEILSRFWRTKWFISLKGWGTLKLSCENIRIFHIKAISIFFLIDNIDTKCHF